MSGGMTVPPHPHTGLQTVSWLFEERSITATAWDRTRPFAPGELNLMTAGRGIQHSRSRSPRPRCCTAPSCGSPCRRRPGTPRRSSNASCRSRSSSRVLE
ncbi:MAG: pirin family protein [Galbitalea sp.]